MKINKKILLASCLGVLPIVISTPLIVASCSTKEENPLAKTYQREYQKDMSLFLDVDKQKIVKETKNNKIIESEYCAFQDNNQNSSTYNGYYLLLRDTTNNNEIFATFCGWTDEYTNKHPEIKTNNYTIPNKIKLPDNYKIDKINKNEFVVKGLGYVTSDYKNSKEDGFNGSKELMKRYGFQDNKDAQFINFIFSGSPSENIDLPFVYVTRNFNLENNPLKYIFGQLYGSRVKDEKEIKIQVTFPETLIFLGVYGSSGPIGFDTIYDYISEVTLDFSKTQLIEIKSLDIRTKNVNIKLPKSCIRIEEISCSSLETNLTINLENILYYENYFGSDKAKSIRAKTINGKDNEIIINKNAKYFPESFPEGFEVKFFE